MAFNYGCFTWAKLVRIRVTIIVSFKRLNKFSDTNERVQKDVWSKAIFNKNISRLHSMLGNLIALRFIHSHIKRGGLRRELTVWKPSRISVVTMYQLKHFRRLGSQNLKNYNKRMSTSVDYVHGLQVANDQWTGHTSRPCKHTYSL